MKILHIGMGLQPGFARELKKLGGYRFIDWTQYMDLGAKDVFRRDVLKISNDMDPDITFLHVQRSGVIDIDIAQRLKGRVFNWTYDVLDPIPDWYYELAPHIDCTLFCNDDDVEEFKKHDLDSEYLQIGYDENVFKSEGTRTTYADVVFLGNNYHAGMNYPLTSFRSDMVAFMKDGYGDAFKVYGNNWSYGDGNLMYKEQKEAECYRSCKIAINVSHFDRRRYTSDRMFRIMGSGAFCLTKWYPEIEKDFIDGIHLKTWKTFEELKDLTDYYLKHEDERIRIARQGMIHVRENCTWTKRIEEFKEMAKARLSKEYKSKTVKIAQQFYLKEQNRQSQRKKDEVQPAHLPVESVLPQEEQLIDQAQAIIVPSEDFGIVKTHNPTFFPQSTPRIRRSSEENAPNYMRKFNEDRIDYDALRRACYIKMSNQNPVDVSVIIPVRGRTNFHQILVSHLKAAFAACPERTFSITFVEHNATREHEYFLLPGVNYIQIPFNESFNKCLCFNAGVLFSNKAKHYLFHDLDIIMKRNFFNHLFANLKRAGTAHALQAFRKRRVLYCDATLTNSLLRGKVSIESITNNSHGINEPVLPEQMRAPGGSIFTSRDQFFNAGGYDAELFHGYSIEDQFFYDKLSLTCGIHSCNDPGIELFHLNHPPMWSTNPQFNEHIQLYEKFASQKVKEKHEFINLEKNNIIKYA